MEQTGTTVARMANTLPLKVLTTADLIFGDATHARTNLWGSVLHEVEDDEERDFYDKIDLLMEINCDNFESLVDEQQVRR